MERVDCTPKDYTETMPNLVPRGREDERPWERGWTMPCCCLLLLAAAAVLGLLSAGAYMSVPDMTYLPPKNPNMADRNAENESSCTRVSAKTNTRRRFVGTKSFSGQKTDKLAGT